MTRALASSSLIRRCWVTFVILGLARVPMPVLVPGPTGLEAHAVAHDPMRTGSGWQWRWTALCPGSLCSPAEVFGSENRDDDCDADGLECESDGEYVPVGGSRLAIRPRAIPAFDRVPLAGGAATPVGLADRLRNLGGSLIGSPSRLGWLQRWTC